MAVLNSSQRDEVYAEIMGEFSGLQITVPVPKTSIRSFVDTLDDELEDYDAAVLAALPAGEGKDWITANPDVGRRMAEITLTKRVEVL